MVLSDHSINEAMAAGRLVIDRPEKLGAGRIGAATGSEHISFLARQESLWSGFSVRKRLAKTHNLVKPSLEPRGDRKVVHRVANYDDVSRLKFFDQFVRILERRTVCRRVLFRV